MFRQGRHPSSHFGIIGVHKVTLPKADFLHATVRNLEIQDTCLQSIAVFDQPAMVVIVIDRPSLEKKRLFRKSAQRQRYQITLHLRKLTTRSNLSELSYGIKALTSGTSYGTGKDERLMGEEDWVKAFHTKLMQNISKTGARLYEASAAA